jgi:hypothetical protein
MTTARIVVLAIAVGAIGGDVACAACGAISGRPSSAQPAAHPISRTGHDSDPLRLALNAITNPDILHSGARDDRPFRRGDNINVTTQK